MDLNNKTVWITGATSGIGEALAQLCSAQGARLVLCARRVEALQRVRKQCQSPERHRILQLDLAQAEQAMSRIADELASNPGADLLINNAGIGQRSLVMETDFAVDRAVIETNVLGSIAVSKALLPTLLESRGSIVVVSSVVGRVSTPKRSAYAASKHALHGWFEGLRAETADQGLHILLACPGYVRTQFSIQALTADGSSQGFRDPTHETGMSPEYCAQRILKALKAGKSEHCIAKPREKLAWILSYVAPWLLRRIVRRVNTT